LITTGCREGAPAIYKRIKAAQAQASSEVAAEVVPAGTCPADAIDGQAPVPVPPPPRSIDLEIRAALDAIAQALTRLAAAEERLHKALGI
jgi:hypothetical protein